MRAARMRIGARLGAGFGVAVILVVTMGATGYIGTTATRGEAERLHRWAIPSLDYLVEADRDLQQLLVAERSMIFADVASEQFAALRADYDENLQQSGERWDAFEALQDGDRYAATMAEYRKRRAEWLEISGAIVDGRASDTREGRRLAIDLSLSQGAVAFEAMREQLNTLQEALLADVAAAAATSAAAYQRTTIVMLAGAATALVVSTLLAILITLGITRPLARVTTAADKMARGSLNVGDLGVHSRDELGDLARAFQRMAEAIAAKGAVLDRMAGGDLTAVVAMSSEEDGLGQALSTTVGSLHDLIAQTRVSVAQISAGAEQVAQASQALSQGATEQASSLEEVSSALTQVSGQARQNADNATAANQLARTAVGNAEKGSEQLRGLVTAMETVNTGSREITKIVKLIDDIAFQINLLALNANVEAARAGKYGKGFAVVADEVRNLAVRSAAAVRDTTQMVEQTTGSIENGSRVAEAMAGQFGEIVQSVNKVADLLGEIALASREQAEGVAQITTGLGQVDTVTQANTATAEESAAAAEELSAQVQQLGAHVARFTVRQQAEPGIVAAKEKAAPPPTSAAKTQKKNGNGHAAVAAAAKIIDPRQVVRLDDDKFGEF